MPEAKTAEWFYVHRYGPWHIALNANDTLCGVKPSLTYWNSRMKFRDYDPRIEADERPVCAICLLKFPLSDDEDEEPESCYFCSTDGVHLERHSMGGKTGWLCDVCAGSFAGNAYFYPEIQHPGHYALFQVMSQQTNMILKALKPLSQQQEEGGDA